MNKALLASCVLWGFVNVATASDLEQVDSLVSVGLGN